MSNATGMARSTLRLAAYTLCVWTGAVYAAAQPVDEQAPQAPGSGVSSQASPAGDAAKQKEKPAAGATGVSPRLKEYQERMRKRKADSEAAKTDQTPPPADNSKTIGEQTVPQKPAAGAERKFKGFRLRATDDATGAPATPPSAQVSPAPGVQPLAGKSESSASEKTEDSSTDRKSSPRHRFRWQARR